MLCDCWLCYFCRNRNLDLERGENGDEFIDRHMSNLSGKNLGYTS